MDNQVRKLIEKYEELEHQLAQEEVASNPDLFAKLHKSYKDMQEAEQSARIYLQLKDVRQEWDAVLRSGEDAELSGVARHEIDEIDEQLEDLEQKLQILMVPKSPFDDRNAHIEIRAGTGGDESSLFAGDLYRMYRACAEDKGWRCEVTDVSEGTVGGYKEVRFLLSGAGVYGALKFESGVHRVQRVPATESQGRVHTSAATVAVMPEAEEVDVEIKEADLKIDTYRAGGAGGQHVNKTDSAVRITHIPTGVVVACQSERSQHKNRNTAMKELRARILDKALADQERKEASARKAQVGTGDRSGKIRTYNFPQNRLTDHRIELTLYKLEQFMGGDMQELLDSLQLADAEEKLRSLEL